MLSEKENEADRRNEIFLQKVSADNLIHLINRFDRYYRKLQRDALTNPEQEEELNELNQTLSGEVIDSEEMRRNTGAWSAPSAAFPQKNG